MKELIEYRRKLVERLAEAAGEFCSACDAGTPDMQIEGEWNLHQIAAHVRDVGRLVYGARVRRTLQEEDPLFQNFDADEWMVKNYKQDETLQKMLSEFKTDVNDLCASLSGMPQTGWSHISRHETLGGGLTLQLWVERSLAHIEEHLQTILKLK